MFGSPVLAGPLRLPDAAMFVLSRFRNMSPVACELPAALVPAHGTAVDPVSGPALLSFSLLAERT